MKKLYRSEEDKIVAGIIGGIGEYLDIDSTALRLAYILIAIATGIFPAIIGYFIALLIVPKKPVVVHMHHTEKKAEEKTESKPEEKKEEVKEEPKTENNN